MLQSAQAQAAAAAAAAQQSSQMDSKALIEAQMLDLQRKFGMYVCMSVCLSHSDVFKDRFQLKLVEIALCSLSLTPCCHVSLSRQSYRALVRQNVLDIIYFM